MSNNQVITKEQGQEIVEQEDTKIEIAETYGKNHVDPITLRAVMARKKLLQELRDADPTYPRNARTSLARSAPLTKRNYAKSALKDDEGQQAKSKSGSIKPLLQPLATS